LRQIAAGAAIDKGAQFRSASSETAALLNVPHAPLNLLETLPRPLSLDEVKERPRATSTTRNRQTK
jgi:hypothetical protein